MIKYTFFVLWYIEIQLSITRYHTSTLTLIKNVCFVEYNKLTLNDNIGEKNKIKPNNINVVFVFSFFVLHLK